MTGGLSRRQLLKLGALAPAAIALAGIPIPTAAAATARALPGVVPSRKKGVGVARLAAQGAYRVQSMNPAWYYTWAPDGIDGLAGVEFVPMVWGVPGDYDSQSKLPDVDVDATNPDAQAAGIQKQVDAVAALGPGKRPVVLGFNEPDGEGQSDMSVDEAVAFWPEVSDLAALTVSPAPIHPFDPWPDEFFQRAAALGLKVDYAAVHMYPGGDGQGGLQAPADAAATFLDTIDQVYEVRGIPVWVTEFALADWGWKVYGGGRNRYSADDSLTFMQAVLPELERRPHVARYAWYGAGPSAATSPPLGPSALFDTTGVMTPLGEFYAQFGAPRPTAATSPVQAGGASR